VRGDVRDDCGLASRVRGMPWCAAQVSRGGLGLSGRLARLHHLYLTTHPSPSLLDRHTRSPIVGLSRLEQAEDVLRARCRPESEEVVMRLGEGPTATRRHEAGVSDLREDHRRQSYHLDPLTQSRSVETPKSDRRSGARQGGRPPGCRIEARATVRRDGHCRAGAVGAARSTTEESARRPRRVGCARRPAVGRPPQSRTDEFARRRPSSSS
jgi:hypothetical protein